MKYINIPQENKYLPKDLRKLLPSRINKEDFKDYNFFYVFNLPKIFERKGKIKININEEIENFKWEEGWINSINRRKDGFIKQMNNAAFETSSFKAELSWRMVIGLGRSHPQETSMTLHHIYGIPYIPGSAIKGVTRHWIILDKFDNNEEKAEKDEDVRNIFGTQEGVGKVIFLDAYPVDEIKLKIDVMTPHYGEYYSDSLGKTPPADWLLPNPIKFLTVEKTRFRFYLASKNNNLLQKAESWLKEALQSFGIGAKTAIGYGYFE